MSIILGVKNKNTKCSLWKCDITKNTEIFSVYISVSWYSHVLCLELLYFFAVLFGFLKMKILIFGWLTYILIEKLHGCFFLTNSKRLMETWVIVFFFGQRWTKHTIMSLPWQQWWMDCDYCCKLNLGCFVLKDKEIWKLWLDETCFDFICGDMDIQSIGCLKFKQKESVRVKSKV